MIDLGWSLLTLALTGSLFVATGRLDEARGFHTGYGASCSVFGWIVALNLLWVGYELLPVIMYVTYAAFLVGLVLGILGLLGYFWYRVRR